MAAAAARVQADQAVAAVRRGRREAGQTLAAAHQAAAARQGPEEEARPAHPEAAEAPH